MIGLQRKKARIYCRNIGVLWQNVITAKMTLDGAIKRKNY